MRFFKNYAFFLQIPIDLFFIGTFTGLFSLRPFRTCHIHRKTLVLVREGMNYLRKVKMRRQKLVSGFPCNQIHMFEILRWESQANGIKKSRRQATEPVSGHVNHAYCKIFFQSSQVKSAEFPLMFCKKFQHSRPTNHRCQNIQSSYQLGPFQRRTQAWIAAKV